MFVPGTMSRHVVHFVKPSEETRGVTTFSVLGTRQGYALGPHRAQPPWPPRRGPQHVQKALPAKSPFSVNLEVRQ
jgi:hypothetical protein